MGGTRRLDGLMTEEENYKRKEVGIYCLFVGYEKEDEY
jgi:hypothetical protein